MQLLVILALLLYGGKNNARELIEEVKPLVESLGGEDLKSALQSAEQLTEVLSAVSAFTPVKTQNNEPESVFTPTHSSAFAPISNIVDENIGYAMKQYLGADA